MWDVRLKFNALFTNLFRMFLCLFDEECLKNFVDESNNAVPNLFYNQWLMEDRNKIQ